MLTLFLRLTLNFKGLSYRTEFIELPDIEAFYKKNGIAPVEKKVDGSPFYTLPVIYDPSTDKFIADTPLIAEYLDKTYPDTPSLFPYNSLALQASFGPALNATIIPSIIGFLVPLVCSRLNPVSAKFFRETRESVAGVPYEALAFKEEEADEKWVKVHEAFGKVDAWYQKSGGQHPFLLGDTVSWADVVVASYLRQFKYVFGEDSQKWNDVMRWHDGRWKRLLEHLDKYFAVVL